MIIQAVFWVLRVIEWAIIIRALMSFLPIQRGGGIAVIYELLYQLTEPILSPIRGLLERSSFGRNMMVDFSPLIALLLIQLLMELIARMYYFY